MNVLVRILLAMVQIAAVFAGGAMIGEGRILSGSIMVGLGIFMAWVGVAGEA
jgi:hypothetical protein